MKTSIALLFLSISPLIVSIVFFLKMRRSYLRTKALHDRFEMEDRLCTAAQLRGDYEQARKHLDYMEVLHRAHFQ